MLKGTAGAPARGGDRSHQPTTGACCGLGWAGPAEAGYPGVGPGVPAAQPMQGAMPPPIASRPLMSGPPIQQHYQQQPIMQRMHQAQPQQQAPLVVMYSSRQPQQAQHFPPQQQPLFVTPMVHHMVPPACPRAFYPQAAPGPPHMLASAPTMQHPPPVAGQPSPGVGWPGYPTLCPVRHASSTGDCLGLLCCWRCNGQGRQRPFPGRRWC